MLDVMSAAYGETRQLALRMLIVVLALVVFLLMFGSMSEFEGRVFPVVAPMQPGPVTTVFGGVVFKPVIDKRRACEFRDVQFYRGDRNAVFERVSINTKWSEATPRPDFSRPTGTQQAGYWFIGMSRDDFLNNSFSIVTHRCHGGYLTVTTWWERRSG